jgi:cytochrome c oxidase cbb3-type subunit IV
MTLAEFSGYGYFGLTVFLAVMLWWYIFHLYSSEKRGQKDYEKYGNMVLHDEITDELVEKKEEEDLHKSKTSKDVEA